MLKGLGLTIVLFSSALAFGKNPTPVMFSDLQAELPETRRAFRPPTYEGQEDALGYSPQAFAVPPGMEARVSFWIDIYTKYSTDQGLLHDSRYPEIVYESVDFRPIMQNPGLNVNFSPQSWGQSTPNSTICFGQRVILRSIKWQGQAGFYPGIK